MSLKNGFVTAAASKQGLAEGTLEPPLELSNPMSAQLPFALLLLFSYVRAQATTCGTCIGSPRDPVTGNIRCNSGRSVCAWCQIGGGGFCFQPLDSSCNGGTEIDTSTSCPIPPSPIAAAALTGAVGQSVALPCVCCLVPAWGIPPAPYLTLTLTLARPAAPPLASPPSSSFASSCSQTWSGYPASP